MAVEGRIRSIQDRLVQIAKRPKVRQSGLTLGEAVADARALLMPICEAEDAAEPFTATWDPGGPWRR